MSMSPVRQPFHIFRKDAIHLWPETLVSIALLVAFAWADAQSLLPADGTFNPTAFAHGLLKFLIPVAWLVLISRLVHEEELVGDRQFWTTRPYTWYSLLAAKVLYLAVFIGLPFFIMQAWLLHHAGLYPTLLVPALLRNLLIIALIFLLPLLAIAAVTATFVRYISSVLVGIVYFFVVVALAAWKMPESITAPNLDIIVFVALIALLVAAMVVQYARRKTLIARLLLIATPLAVVLCGLLAPASVLVEHRYPDTSIGTLAFDADPTQQQPQGRLFVFQHKVILSIPVQAELPGLSRDSFVLLERVRVVLDGPGGLHYASNWSENPESLSPGQLPHPIQVPLPEDFFEKARSLPVAMHIQFGARVYKPGTPYVIDATESPFPLPDHANCAVLAEDGTLDCRFPFNNPNYMRVASVVHEGNCLVPGPRSAQAFGSVPPTPIGFGFSPVEQKKVKFAVGESTVPLCPGAGTTFTTAEGGGYGRLHLDIPSIMLDGYAIRMPVGPAGPANQ